MILQCVYALNKIDKTGQLQNLFTWQGKIKIPKEFYITEVLLIF